MVHSFRQCQPVYFRGWGAVLGLCCMSFSCSCREQGLLSSCGVPASHRSGFSYCGAQALGHVGSVALTPRLQSTGSTVVVLYCSVARGILLDQGSSLCLLHWQVGCLPTKSSGRTSHHCSLMFFLSLTPYPFQDFKYTYFRMISAPPQNPAWFSCEFFFQYIFFKLYLFWIISISVFSSFSSLLLYLIYYQSRLVLFYFRDFIS